MNPLQIIGLIVWPLVCMVAGYCMGVGDHRNRRWPAWRRGPQNYVTVNNHPDKETK